MQRILHNIYRYRYIVFSTFFSLNIHFRCLNIYFFQDKMFYGSKPIIILNKTDTGAFFTMISRIFTEYDQNCFTFITLNVKQYCFSLL